MLGMCHPFSTFTQITEAEGMCLLRKIYYLHAKKTFVNELLLGRYFHRHHQHARKSEWKKAEIKCNP
jgi:hypothetical protein